MNNIILKKAIDELKLEKPKIDYVLGMLETLYEMGKIPDDAYLKADGKGKVKVVSQKEELDEASLLDAKARAAIDTIKNLGISE